MFEIPAVQNNEMNVFIEGINSDVATWATAIVMVGESYGFLCQSEFSSSSIKSVKNQGVPACVHLQVTALYTSVHHQPTRSNILLSLLTRSASWHEKKTTSTLLISAVLIFVSFSISTQYEKISQSFIWDKFQNQKLSLDRRKTTVYYWVPKYIYLIGWELWVKKTLYILIVL